MKRLATGQLPVTSAATRPTGRRWRTVLSASAFLVVMLVPAVRVALDMNVPGRIDYSEWALSDFRDNVYYPVRSFLDGGNPYDRAAYTARYPVRVRFPPYTPLYLLVHLPFGMLSHTAAQLLYLALSGALSLGLAHLTLRMCGRHPTTSAVFLLAALIVFSRPGHRTLMLGQTTLEFVIAAYVALYFGVRSAWISGVAVGFATMKATVAAPLVVFMLSERLRRPVVIGIGVACVAILVPTVILAHSAGGLGELAATYLSSFAVFEHDPSANPVLSTSRIDAVALCSRLVGAPLAPVLQMALFALFMVAASATIRRVRARSSGRGACLYCMSTASLGMLVALYQQAYSALLLVLPLTALVLDCWAPDEFKPARALRIGLIVLLSIPALNHLIAARVLQYFEPGGWTWTLLVSINGAAMVVAFVVYVSFAFRSTSTTRVQHTSPQ